MRNFLVPGVTPPSIIRERQQKARDDAYERSVANLSFAKRRIFDRVLNESRRHIAQREQMKDLLILNADRGRQLFRRVETLLVEAGLLGNGDDLYFLLVDEVLALGRGELSSAEAVVIVARRRQDYEWSLRVKVPHLQEGEARILPADGAGPGTAESANTDDVITGIGVSPGRIEGVARVVSDPRVNSQLEPGEILVARVTDLGWTPLFLNAAGLVVDVGGLLSHGSIVAREYGLPAVVGATGATGRIRSGDRIRVDGDRGEVRIVTRS